MATLAVTETSAHLHGVVAALGAELEGGVDEPTAPVLLLRRRAPSDVRRQPRARSYGEGSAAIRAPGTGLSLSTTGLGGQAEDALPHHVALDLVAAAGDADRRRAQERLLPATAVGRIVVDAACRRRPAPRGPARRCASGSTPRRILRTEASGPGRQALAGPGAAAVPEVPHDLGAGVRGGQALTHDRVARRLAVLLRQRRSGRRPPDHCCRRPSSCARWRGWSWPRPSRR